MKPTSIIFLILSVILIISGVIICVIAGALAKNDGIELYVDYYDDNGNAVVEHDLTGKKPSEIKIDLDKAYVSVIGGAEKSYVKVENYPTKAYDYWVTDGSVNMKDAGILSIFTSIRINEAGFGFNGLRHYLALGKYKGMQRRVTVFLAKETILNTIDISVKEGGVKLSGVEVRSDCKINIVSGDANIVDLTAPGTTEITCENGNITFDKCLMTSAKAEITEKGDIECLIDMQYSFALKCVSGGVYLDSIKSGSDYSGLYPADPLERKEPVKEPDDTEKPADTDKPAEPAETDDKPGENAPGGEGETGDVSDVHRMFVCRVKLGDIKIKTANE